jgi:hypothetical protein
MRVMRSLLMEHLPCLTLRQGDEAVVGADVVDEEEVLVGEDEEAEHAEVWLEPHHLLDLAHREPQHPCSHSQRKMMVHPIRQRQTGMAWQRHNPMKTMK